MPGFNSPKLLADASPQELREAQRHCAKVARQAAGNFYYAFIFLPLEQRSGIEALYAFCRAGDDAIDENVQINPAGKLDELAERLDICYELKYIDPNTLALADAIQRFGFERPVFNELLAGLRADLTMHSYANFAELRRYCYCVASTIGLHCLKIFGADTEPARNYAEHLGIGMQLTNILRDLREDYNRGRIYLPVDEMKRFSCTPDDLFTEENLGRLKALTLRMADTAEGYFARADELLPRELYRKLTVARIMGRIYRQILQKIKSLERFDQRVELTPVSKLAAAYQVLTEGETL